MVEVISPDALREAAGAAREHARRLRADSYAHRAELRRSMDGWRHRRPAYARTMADAGRARERRYRSTWSDLAWQLPDRELDTVLVPIDGKSSEVDPRGIEPLASRVPLWRSPS